MNLLFPQSPVLLQKGEWSLCHLTSPRGWKGPLSLNRALPSPDAHTLSCHRGRISSARSCVHVGAGLRSPQGPRRAGLDSPNAARKPAQRALLPPHATACPRRWQTPMRVSSFSCKEGEERRELPEAHPAVSPSPCLRGSRAPGRQVSGPELHAQVLRGHRELWG